jgi:hypothetical protein
VVIVAELADEGELGEEANEDDCKKAKKSVDLLQYICSGQILYSIMSLVKVPGILWSLVITGSQKI